MALKKEKIFWWKNTQSTHMIEVQANAMEQSWWANMPHELLREVLLRIESSESTWPLRRSVVACGGVCRTWRRLIVKEIVKPPQFSSNITFPISLKQVQCSFSLFKLNQFCLFSCFKFGSLARGNIYFSASLGATVPHRHIICFSVYLVVST